MDKAVVQAALDDWQTAPISERLRAALGFLVKLNNTPDDVSHEDIRALEQQGLDKEAIAEAAYVCFCFNIIDRLADAFEFEMSNEDELRKGSEFLFTNGYNRSSLRG